MSPLAIFLIVSALLAALWVVGQPVLRRRRWQWIRQGPFPDDWLEILQRRVPLYRRLPPALRRQLQGHILVFLEEKDFAGCQGLTVNDEMRVTIAAQAALLLLNRATDYYPDLRVILVYPAEFVVNRNEIDAAGVHSSEERVLAGESWSDGKVIVAWNQVVHGSNDAQDGENVVLHEFAHQLDHESGAVNGSPAIADAAYRTWSQVLGEEFERLQRQAHAGAQSLIDDYGAQDPGEFFAVVTESFFERPCQLQAEHPALYDELRKFYRVSPADWH